VLKEASLNSLIVERFFEQAYIKFICSSANQVPFLVLSGLVSFREGMNGIFVPKISNSSTGIQEVESNSSQVKRPALIRANESPIDISCFWFCSWFHLKHCAVGLLSTYNAFFDVQN